MLAVEPDDELLEIGCGGGVAVALICDQLEGGRVTAIDRSAKMIERAEQRNADQVAAGKAVLHTMALEEAADGLGDARFDKIFAVNVNLFWVREPTEEIRLLARLLRPGGALYLFYEPPEPSRARALAQQLRAMFAGHGFSTSTPTTAKGVFALVAALDE